MTPQRSWTRGLAATLFIVLAALAAQHRLGHLLSTLDPGVRARLATAADTRWPEYPKFLDQVRQATRPGDRIALAFPAGTWEGGYAYGYYRASYMLAGREVSPLLSERDEPLPQNFQSANCIAVFRTRIPPGPYRVVLSTPDGILVRR